MKTSEFENLISQNDEKIKKKEAQIKKLKDEVKELKAKNEQLQDDMLLSQVKNNIGSNDVSKLIKLSKLIEESGLDENEIAEMFSKGDVKDEV